MIIKKKKAEAEKCYAFMPGTVFRYQLTQRLKKKNNLRINNKVIICMQMKIKV